jgi:glutamate/tyrosine decarboxylase-like PLP-dependent enzyme
MDLQGWLASAVAAVAEWQEGFGPFEADPSMLVSEERFASVFAEFTGRLRDNYPFFHPSYAGQMLKPPHPAAVAGYLAAMLINPNNHALDGGPATGQMEKEAVATLAAMFGLDTHLGHLATSGTVANLEALFVARETHPGLGVAYSEEAHYTHARMCGVLGIEGTAVPADGAGRMDIGALDDLLAGGRIGTVVATTGTTGLGAIDPVHEVLAVARHHGARVHVDAAYGGFFTLLASRAGQPSQAGHADQAGHPDQAGQAGHPDQPGQAGQPDQAGQAGQPDLAGQAGQPGLDPAPWRAIAECDSVVVDPHKHGLQPYGCGAVLFKDPEVGRFYLHDSPYTYFTSDELHLGEISLECSRAGASAAALWLTLRLLPLTPDGLGRVLAACRRAALDWAALIGESGLLELYQPPELDIVCYFPHLPGGAMSGIDDASVSMLARGMKQDRPVFLSTLRVTSAGMSRRHPGIVADRDGARILRSVLMKPEARDYVSELHARVEELAGQATG